MELNGSVGQSDGVGAFWSQIKSLASVSVVLAALLFDGGWSYLYGYYRSFGISLIELNPSAQVAATYCLALSRSYGFWCVFLFLVLSAFGIELIHSYRPIASQLLTFVSVVLLVTAFIWLSHIGVTAGERHAQTDMSSETSTLPYVTIVPESHQTDAPESACSMLAANYKFLIRTSGHVYVFLPLETSESSQKGNLRVCSFQESQIGALRLQVPIDLAH